MRFLVVILASGRRSPAALLVLELRPRYGSTMGSSLSSEEGPFDAVDAIDDHDLSLLTALCGGAAALLTVDDALDYTRALGLRLGRLFSGDDVRDAVETLLKIQKYELDRGPADPSNPTVSAGELVEHLKERRHAKQQRADKIRHMQGLSPATDSPERRALSASAPVDADREALAREATSSSCEASSTVVGTTIG